MDGRRSDLMRQVLPELSRRFSNSYSLQTEALIDCLDLEIGSGLDSFCTKPIFSGDFLGLQPAPHSQFQKPPTRGCPQDDQPREFLESQLQGKLDLPRVRHGA